jgi:hypothetical protein
MWQVREMKAQNPHILRHLKPEMRHRILVSLVVSVDGSV